MTIIKKQKADPTSDADIEVIEATGPDSTKTCSDSAQTDVQIPISPTLDPSYVGVLEVYGSDKEVGFTEIEYNDSNGSIDVGVLNESGASIDIASDGLTVVALAIEL